MGQNPRTYWAPSTFLGTERMHITCWKDVCNKAAEAAKNLPLVIASQYADMKPNNGPCKLLGIVIEANSDYDEESLPVYRVQLQDGRKVNVTEEELTCSDTDGLESLFAGVSMTFGLARIFGEWVGPSHLMDEADEATKANFLVAAHGSIEAKRAALA